MAVVAERRSPTGLFEVVHRPALRHRRIAAATAVGGVAVAVLVGHDGTPGWQFVRVASVAILTLAVIALQTRLSDRGCGRLAVAVGVVVLAIGAGFMPYVVKDRWSVEAVAGTVALVAGLALAAAGTMIGTSRATRRLEDRCRPRHSGGHRCRRVRRGAGRRGHERPTTGDRGDAGQQGPALRGPDRDHR